MAFNMSRGGIMIPTVKFRTLPGANVDVRDADGNTALLVALATGTHTSDVVRQLLAWAAERSNDAPNNERRAPSDNDVTPGRCLHSAIILGADRLAQHRLYSPSSASIPHPIPEDLMPCLSPEDLEMKISLCFGRFRTF
jgi:ankyrin repeat protein